MKSDIKKTTPKKPIVHRHATKTPAQRREVITASAEDREDRSIGLKLLMQSLADAVAARLQPRDAGQPTPIHSGHPLLAGEPTGTLNPKSATLPLPSVPDLLMRLRDELSYGHEEISYLGKILDPILLPENPNGSAICEGVGLQFSLVGSQVSKLIGMAAGLRCRIIALAQRLDLPR